MRLERRISTNKVIFRTIDDQEKIYIDAEVVQQIRSTIKKVMDDMILTRDLTIDINTGRYTGLKTALDIIDIYTD